MDGFFSFRVGQILFAIAWIICPVSATDCKGDFTVSSQQDADTQLASCDTIIGSIIIGGNYSGPLVIPNITNSTEDIMVQSIYEPTGLLLGPQSLTSLQADNVVTMAEGDLCLVDVPVLTYVSMAKLQNADSINIAFNSSGTLNLPALANASDIHVFGSITSMNFTNLATVSEQLYIGSIIPPPDPNIPNMYTGFSYTSYVYATHQGIDITFPALKSAMACIDARAEHCRSTDGVKIKGGIGSISLPSLYHVSGDYSVTCALPMAVYLRPLVSANNFNVTGSITNLNVTSIKSINSQELLQSTYGLDCISLAPSWLNQTTPTIKNLAYKVVGPWTYICYPGIKFHRHKLYPLSTGGMVGISHGIEIPLVIFIIWFVHRKGNKKIAREVEKRREARLNGVGSRDGHELEEREHHDARPIYEPSREGDSAASVGADSGVGVGMEQRPPGYHDAHSTSERTNGGEVRGVGGETEPPKDDE